MTKNTYDIFSSIFKELGISNLACDVYQFFLFNPECTITECAKDLNLQRLKVYQLIEELKSYKLVSHSDKKVIVEPPSALTALLEYQSLKLTTKAHELQQIIPQIEQENVFFKESVVQVFSRKGEFLDIFHRVITEAREGDELLSFGNVDEFYGIIDLDYFLKYFISARLKKNIFTRMISCGKISYETQLNFERKAELKREIRYLKNNDQNGASYWAVGDKVIFWNTQLVRAVVIKDAGAAGLMKQSFEACWEKTPLEYSQWL
jgi:hypothetical protein